MSVSGISSSIFPDYSTQSIQSKSQQFRADFQQLGQDLQSGNLSAAQADLATLQQLGPHQSPAGSNPVVQAFNQLSQDLKSGNISAAKQDFATIQQDIQNQATQPHHHHHHRAGSGASQSLNQLGQALQSGNLSSAQQAYSALQQDFQLFAQSNATQGTQSGSSSISVNA